MFVGVVDLECVLVDHCLLQGQQQLDLGWTDPRTMVRMGVLSWELVGLVVFQVPELVGAVV